MKTILFLPLLVLMLTLASCDFHPTRTLIGYGEPESEEIQVEAFTGVNVTGTCNVILSIGDVQSVWISAQPQIHEALSFKVTNDILQIGVKPDYNIRTDEEITATITLPSFNFAGVAGEGDYFLNGPEQENLEIYISGVGDVEAFDMAVRSCIININGVGNCKVNVSETLEVTVSGTGDIRYMGNPEVESHIHGVGQVRPAD